MKILIVEDDMQQASLLEGLLRGVDPHLDIRGPLSGVREAVGYLTNFQMPDLIFAKPALADGMFYSALLSTGGTVPVVYMAEDSAYAVEAFSHNGLGYLIKPLDTEGVASVLQKWADFFCPNACSIREQPPCPAPGKAPEETSGSHRQRLMVTRASQYEVFLTRKVAYFELKKNQVSAFMEDGTHVPVRATLEEIERQLDPERFFRTNRQTLVNIQQVEHFANHYGGKLLVYLKDFPKKVISVSKEKSARFKTWIDN